MESNETMIEINETELQSKKRQKGVTTVEYAVMLALVAIAVATATPSIRTAVLATFSQVGTALTTAAG